MKLVPVEWAPLPGGPLDVSDPDAVAPEPVEVLSAVLGDGGYVLSLSGTVHQARRVSSVEVRETAEEVTVSVFAGWPPFFAEAGQHLVHDVGRTFRVEIQLDSPLGPRQLYCV